LQTSLRQRDFAAARPSAGVDTDGDDRFRNAEVTQKESTMSDPTPTPTPADQPPQPAPPLPAEVPPAPTPPPAETPPKA